MLAIAPCVVGDVRGDLRARALSVRRGRHGERGRPPRRRGSAFRQPAGRRAARRDPRQAAEDDARRAPRAARTAAARPCATSTLKDAAYRVLQLPAVADKTFLVTIGDRTVGGLCARDPMVGPWQVPVADVAVTLMDFAGHAGEAMAMGERTPLALIDAPASGRMAVGEAITNIAAADIERLSKVKLSANWMAPAGHPGEDAALYDTVRAVAIDTCIRLGIAIPVGKDSMSMRTTWTEDGTGEGRHRAGVAHRLGVRAGARRARNADAAPAPRRGRHIARPARRRRRQAQARRLGARAGVRPARRRGAGPRRSRRARRVLRLRRPPAAQRHAARVPRRRRRRPVRDARGDGVRVALRDSTSCSTASRRSRSPALFAEELGAVVQVRTSDADAFVRGAHDAGTRRDDHRQARRRRPRARRCATARVLLDEARVDLHRAWSSTTHAMQVLRDNPGAAEQEYARLLDASEPGHGAAPDVRSGRRHRRALRRARRAAARRDPARAGRQRPGRDGRRVRPRGLRRVRRAHERPVRAAGGRSPTSQGVVACGGFSYGDVLGAGEGWAKSILFNARLRDQFAAFFAPLRRVRARACATAAR